MRFAERSRDAGRPVSTDSSDVRTAVLRSAQIERGWNHGVLQGLRRDSRIRRYESKDSVFALFCSVTARGVPRRMSNALGRARVVE
jgi:hypothetical protein